MRRTGLSELSWRLRDDEARQIQSPPRPTLRCGVYEWRPCERPDGTERKAFHAERHTKAKFAEPTKATKKLLSKGYGKEWAATRAKVFAMKGAQCVYCGDDASHVDHQTPKSRGGSDDLSNLVPSCMCCNMSKGMMTLEEWRQ